MKFSQVLFEDDFRRYPDGRDIVPYYGLRRIGPWESRNIDYPWFEGSASYHQQSQTWAIEHRDGVGFLVQTGPNFASYICAGDDAWTNYRLEASFSREPAARLRGSSFGCNHDQDRHLTGLLARYQTQRHHYFWGFDAHGVPLLAKRIEEDLTPLFRAGISLADSTLHRWAIQVQDDKITAWLDGQCLVQTVDREYSWGRIGFRTDRMAAFTGVQVFTTRGEIASIRRRQKTARQAHQQAMAACRQPILWKKQVRESDWQRVFLDDLDGSGQARIVHLGTSRQDPRADPPVEVLSVDGDRLWSRGVWVEAGAGSPCHVMSHVTDLAGDGSRRLILAYQDTVEVLDARTGRTLQKCQMPVDSYRSSRVVPPVFGRLLSARLTDGPGRQIIAMSDGYAAALDADLNLLWTHTGNLGHGPKAADVNDDGYDEVMLGYSLLDRHGKVLWSVPGLNTEINDDMLDAHADWVDAARLNPDDPVCLLLAASQKGLFMLSAQGQVLRRHIIGHAQTLAIGAFDSNLRGRQVVVSTLWESAGIYWLFDSQCRPLRRWEMGVFSPVFPLRWPGANPDVIFLPYYDLGPAILDSFGRILWQMPAEIMGRNKKQEVKNNGGIFRHRGMEFDLFTAVQGRTLAMFAPA